MNKNAIHRTKIIVISTLLLSLTLVFIRLLLNFKAPLYTFGYDYGFYAYAFNQNGFISLLTSLPGVLSGFSTPGMSLVKLLPLGTSTQLLTLLFVSQIASSIALFFWLKNKSIICGLLAGLFFSLSLIQNQVSLLFLLKTSVVLPFFILGFYYFEKKKLVPAVIFSVLVVWLHRTTAIIYILTLCGAHTIQRIQNKQWKKLSIEGGLATLAAVACYIFFQHEIFSLVNHANSDVLSGIFFQGHSIFAALWIFILLSLIGINKIWKAQILQTVLALVIITAIWIWFELPFYQRMLIYLDLGLIILAAYSVSNLLKAQKPATTWLVSSGILLILGMHTFVFLYQAKPLVNDQVLSEIQAFNPTEPHAFVLAVDANTAPWLLGFLPGVELPKNYHITTPLQKDFNPRLRLAAPGLFEDPKTKENWDKVWQGHETEQFLAAFPRPLYIYQRGYQLPGLQNSACVIQISASFSQYICP